ncbi:Uncharacterised protein [Vibrio cholerae]|nr:Uncharacterised protein [Vibrio cholerae]
MTVYQYDKQPLTQKILQSLANWARTFLIKIKKPLLHPFPSLSQTRAVAAK